MLEDIARLVRGCERCPLHTTRKNAVPGEGNPQARLMLVGEAPGRWEDEQGRPFVGRAGELLTRTLEGAGISRRDAFITNIVKCRPPSNRRPEREEIEACVPYLNRQIEAIQPKVLASLGATAGEYLFRKYGFRWEGMLVENGRDREIGTLFGRVHLVPVIHPAAVLRDPGKLGYLEKAVERIKALL